MNLLLSLSAVIETGAGLALLIAPSFVVRLLLGSGLDAPAAVTLGRLAGAALLALGVACGLGRGDVQSHAAKSLVVAMLVYNAGAVVILGAAGSRSQPVGVALWPAVILHAVMSLWCVNFFLRKTGPAAK
jgi:hypothetical protein